MTSTRSWSAAARDVTVFMQHVPGLVAKDGADGVFAAALPGRSSGRDEDRRRRRPGPPAGDGRRDCGRLGVDVDTVAPLVEERIMGHGRQVGSVRAIADRGTIPFVTLDDRHYGEIVQVAPLIRRVIAKNPTKFSYHGTGTYIIGAGRRRRHRSRPDSATLTARR